MILAFCKLNENSANIIKKLTEDLLIEFNYGAIERCLNDCDDFYIALMTVNLNLRFVIYSIWEINMFGYKCLPVIELDVYESYVKRMYVSFVSYRNGLQTLKESRENLIEELKHL